jgi:hypothetical protein
MHLLALDVIKTDYDSRDKSIATKRHAFGTMKENLSLGRIEREEIQPSGRNLINDCA